MRFVSEQFKEIQNEIIRPQTKLYFEIGTDIANLVTLMALAQDLTADGFDNTVVPVVQPKNCINEHFYAVLGDQVGVDNPNRICAPYNPATTPTTSVPMGITPFTFANTEALIGDSSEYDTNFIPFPQPVTLSFKGGVIPDTIRVECYDLDTDTWFTETTISNPDLKEEVIFEPTAHRANFRRFWVKNSNTSGRFQMNWMRINYAEMNYETDPVVFEEEYISSVNISTETDLTSQTLPDYTMTVECLDIDEEYTPDTIYWKYLFADNTPCYFKIGYEINGKVEYIPFFYGHLTKAPDYTEGKITFNVAIIWNEEYDFRIGSFHNASLATGNPVESITIFDAIGVTNARLSNLNAFFDTYDVFKDQDDIDNSLVNYYGSIPCGDARQLIANALGSYIRAGVNSVGLYNTNDIQYKTFIDYVTRYDQVQNNLESQPKVGEIVVSRNSNTLSATYSDIVANASITVPANGSAWADFSLPFYAFGKCAVVGSLPSGITADFTTPYEYSSSNGTNTVSITYSNSSGTARTFKPTVRFYHVDNKVFETKEYSEHGAAETYRNDNELITCEHTADKARRVAKFMSNNSSKYEVDLIPDYRYELGDVIRLETQEGVFKSCVITGLNFTFPGSNGHLSCRKIFSLLDSPYAVFGAEGLELTVANTENFTVLETIEGGVVVGKCFDGTYMNFYILDVYKVDINGYPYLYNSTLTDLNGHAWRFYYNAYSTNSLVTTAPVIELPDYDPESGVDEATYGAINMIKAVYEQQGMTAPVDETCVFNH